MFFYNTTNDAVNGWLFAANASFPNPNELECGVKKLNDAVAVVTFIVRADADKVPFKLPIKLINQILLLKKDINEIKNWDLKKHTDSTPE